MVLVSQSIGLSLPPSHFILSNGMASNLPQEMIDFVVDYLCNNEKTLAVAHPAARNDRLGSTEATAPISQFEGETGEAPNRR